MKKYIKLLYFSYLKMVVVVVVLIFCCNICYGTIRYVKTVAAGLGDGSNWLNASSDLQAVIIASGAGDEIWIAAGT